MNARRPLRGLAAATLALSLIGAPSCTRKSDPVAARPQAMPAKGPTIAGDADWMEGRLPPSVNEGTPTPGGTLTVRIHVDPPNLSPHMLDPRDLMATRIVLGKVYETLLKVDSKDHPRYQVVPALAESWEESPDHLTYTFKLRKGVKFHDGKPLTAKDVEFSLAKVLDPKEPTASTRSYFEDIKEYKAVDDSTFKVTLTKPYFLFLRHLGTDIPILPRHLLETGEFRTNPIHQAPVGSGPFKFVEWKKGESITLARNDEYWGKKPYLDRIVFRVVPDHTVATQLFERGEFDLMTQIQHTTWVDMARTPKLVKDFNRIRFFPKNYEWVGWNEERPFFADKRVRTALALLFDRDTFNRTILHNLEKPTTCHFYHEGDECDPGLKPLGYDPERAKALLAEAGWTDSDGDGVLENKDGVKFRFTFLMSTNSVFLSKLTVYLKEAYKKAGIDMDISKAEWAVFQTRVHDHDFDACSMVWGDVDAPTDPYQVWHSSQAKDGSNYVGFRSPRVDGLIEQARLEFDPQKRSAMYRDLGRILYEEQPYMWLNVRPELDAVSKRVHGIYPSLAWYDFNNVWVDGGPQAAAEPAEH